jgi:hypothetical protein
MTVCRSGHEGCCSKVAYAQTENMYKASSPASIRYSGQWRRKLLTAFHLSCSPRVLCSYRGTAFADWVLLTTHPLHDDALASPSVAQRTFPSRRLRDGLRVQKIRVSRQTDDARVGIWTECREIDMLLNQEHLTDGIG